MTGHFYDAWAPVLVSSTSPASPRMAASTPPSGAKSLPAAEAHASETFPLKLGGRREVVYCRGRSRGRM